MFFQKENNHELRDKMKLTHLFQTVCITLIPRFLSDNSTKPDGLKSKYSTLALARWKR